MTSAESAPPIVLIHGLWLSPRSWEGWKERFESRGYRVLAPAWPRMQQDVEEVRRDPSAMNGLGVAEIADHYGDIVRDLDQPPIIMGHSFGGLITELLLDRGLGACGVALSPAPVKGVLRLPPAQLRCRMELRVSRSTPPQTTSWVGRPPRRATSSRAAARTAFSFWAARKGISCKAI